MSVDISNNNIQELKKEALLKALECVEAGLETAAGVAKAECPVGETDDPTEVHLFETVRSTGARVEGSSIEGEVVAGDPTVGVNHAGYVEFGTVHPVGPGPGRPKKEPYTIRPKPYMQPGYEAGRAAAEERAERTFG